MKPIRRRLAFVVLVAVIATAMMLIDMAFGRNPCAHRGPGSVSRWNYWRVGEGMTVDEVFRILGPGKRIPEASVPWVGRPAVTGDEFYEWQEGYHQIVIGFVDGRVYQKWYKNWDYL